MYRSLWESKFRISPRNFPQNVQENTLIALFMTNRCSFWRWTHFWFERDHGEEIKLFLCPNFACQRSLESEKTFRSALIFGWADEFRNIFLLTFPLPKFIPPLFAPPSIDFTVFLLNIGRDRKRSIRCLVGRSWGRDLGPGLRVHAVPSSILIRLNCDIWWMPRRFYVGHFERGSCTRKRLQWRNLQCRRWDHAHCQAPLSDQKTRGT